MRLHVSSQYFLESMNHAFSLFKMGASYTPDFTQSLSILILLLAAG